MDRQGRCCYPPAPHYYWPAPQHYPYAPYGYSPAAPRYCPVPQHYPPARWCDCDWNTQKASANAQALCIDTQVAPYRHPHARYGEAAHRDSSSDRKSQSSSPDLTGNETDETTPASSPVKRSLSYSQRTCRKNGPEAFHYTNGDGSKTSVTVSEVKQQLIDSSSLVWAQQGHDRLDEAANRMFPMNTGGVHVFLDVSNIYISFLNTIKEGLNIPPNTKIWPQPDFDWKALTELVLCRGRQASTLMAGCSLNPHDRQPPSYIKTLEDIGFMVDVRTRKRKEDGSYKEFMVDECIQAAIEDVVSPRNGAIAKPGTLLIVTGDGKPAEHSSGFVKYASHAIDDGWKIEVVNWNTGCSTKWVPEDWKGYGACYRRIALDDYLGGLLGSKFT